MQFVLDPRLEATTAFVADWPLSRVLLVNDARFPWLILVPRLPGTCEIFGLEAHDRVMLSEEFCVAGERLKRLTGCKKINICAIGNVVPQLHIHVIARNEGDAAWPSPVWGSGDAVPYAPEALADILARLVNAL
jgi:diadenosine tetraphosphate (Ap4A) HIT family hydrolase